MGKTRENIIIKGEELEYIKSLWLEEQNNLNKDKIITFSEFLLECLGSRINKNKKIIFVKDAHNNIGSEIHLTIDFNGANEIDELIDSIPAELKNSTPLVLTLHVDKFNFIQSETINGKYRNIEVVVMDTPELPKDYMFISPKMNLE